MTKLKRWRHDFSHGSISNDGFWTPYQEAADRIAQLEKLDREEHAALRQKVAALTDSLTVARREIRTLKDALSDIARQHTADEREYYDEEDGDVEGAYDTVIGIVRSLLSGQEKG